MNACYQKVGRGSCQPINNTVFFKENSCSNRSDCHHNNRVKKCDPMTGVVTMSQMYAMSIDGTQLETYENFTKAYWGLIKGKMGRLSNFQIRSLSAIYGASIIATSLDSGLFGGILIISSYYINGIVRYFGNSTSSDNSLALLNAVTYSVVGLILGFANDNGFLPEMIDNTQRGIVRAA